MAEVPQWIWIAPVGISAKACAAALWSFAASSEESPRVYPSRDLLGSMLGISDRTLRRYLTDLQNAGAITRESDAWRLHFRPAPVVEAPESSELDRTNTAIDRTNTATDRTNTAGQIRPSDKYGHPNRTNTANTDLYGILDQNVGSPLNPPLPAESPPNPTTREAKAQERRNAHTDVVDALTFRVPRPTPPGASTPLRVLLCPFDKLGVLLDAGETPEGVIETATRTSIAITAGLLPPEFWSLLWTNWYQRLRDRRDDEQIALNGKRGKGRDPPAWAPSAHEPMTPEQEAAQLPPDCPEITASTPFGDF